MKMKTDITTITQFLRTALDGGDIGEIAKNVVELERLTARLDTVMAEVIEWWRVEEVVEMMDKHYPGIPQTEDNIQEFACCLAEAGWRAMQDGFLAYLAVEVEDRWDEVEAEDQRADHDGDDAQEAALEHAS